jgi:hypothetical protein
MAGVRGYLAQEPTAAEIANIMVIPPITPIRTYVVRGALVTGAVVVTGAVLIYKYFK